MANSNFVVKNGLTVGALTIDASTGNITTSGTISGDLATSSIAKNDTSLALNDTGTGSDVAVTVDGTEIFTITGDGIIPSVDSDGSTGFSLGSASFAWKDVYVSSGSLYVNGQKVLQDDSGTIVVSADSDQNLSFQTSGSGNVELNATGSGLIAVKSTLQIEDGINITNSAGNAITFANSIDVDAIESRSTDTNLTLSANGSGVVTVNDNCTITGNLTVSGTTTTVNSETISLADNMIDLNSNFTSGTPSENSGIRIMRGDSTNVTFIWDEGNDRWTVGSSNMVAGTFIGALTGNVTGNVTGDVTGDLTGNADTATALATTRAIQVSGAVTGTANFDGSAAINIVTTNTADPTVTLTGAVTGSGTLTNLGDVTITTTATADPTVTLTGAVTGSGTLTNLGDVTITTTATADPTLTLAGDLSGSATFTNLGNATLTATIAANSVALGTDTTGNYVAAGATSGSGISGSVSSEGGTFTVTSNATNANTGSTIVFRDGSGNFSAGTITANLTGNASGSSGSCTGNSATATTATNVTVSANNTANETVYLTFVDGATGTQGLETDTGLSYNPSTNVLATTASQAQYADLAERYEAEAPVEPGTVVHFGGSKEIKECDEDGCSKVAGIISTTPAYMMNADAGDDSTHPYVALKGRVPCKVQGSIKKGDMMVSAGNGRARAEADPKMGSVIGKAIADSEGEAVIEVVVL